MAAPRVAVSARPLINGGGVKTRLRIAVALAGLDCESDGVSDLDSSGNANGLGGDGVPYSWHASSETDSPYDWSADDEPESIR
jgi:hypothetical protein